MYDGGRPTVCTPDVLKKLEQAFLAECSDEEACQFAGISPATLYNYQKAHPGYLEHKRLLKQNVGAAAKLRLAQAIPESAQDARWYLERKRSDQYGAKQVIEVTHKVDDKQLIDSLRQLMIESSTTGSADVIDAEYSTTEPDNLIDHVSP